MFPPLSDQGPADDLPLTIHRGHLLLARGAIGRLGNRVLLLDTGSGRTIISTAVAAALDLRGHATQLESFGERVRVEEAVIPDLHLGALHTGTHPVVVANLAATAASLDLKELDGLVGIDVLRRRNFLVDYTKRQIRFGTAASMPYKTPFAPSPIFVVVGLVTDGIPRQLIVDTGASHLVLFAGRGAKGEVIRDQPAHLAGATPVRSFVIGELRIGSWRRRRVPALIANASAANPEDLDGLLGLPALGSKQVQFDFDKRELGWKP